VATLVFFHAHPDDECIATGGCMAKAARDGHRVVLVTAKRGEHGEVVEGVLEPGEQLWERRVVETAESARILGVSRHEFLGYVDSGMMGTPENDARGSFWSADIDEAAAKLAAILQDEDADVLTVYDSNGNYGHPDHIQVHRVGVRAAEMAGTPNVFEATMNRTDIQRQIREAAANGAEVPGDVDPEDMTIGVSEDVLTTRVDVREFANLKREAMVAHASQIPPTSWFLSMPIDAFTNAFGTEWFIHRGAPSGIHEDSIV